MASGGEEQAVLKLLDVITMHLVPMALKAAVKLKVMDILAEHAGGQDQFLSATQIASHFESRLASTTTLDQAATFLDRILRILASHGLLASSSHTSPQGLPTTTYALNSLSHHLVQKKGHPSLAPYLLLVQHPASVQCYFDLHLSLLDGEMPFPKAHGMHLIPYAKQNPEFDTIFNNAMASHSTLFMHSLLETYNGFGDITSLVDVGGGIGASLGMIISKYPHIKGINFDLPHVVAGAPKFPGVEHVGGDMFETIPKSDVIFMKWMLHGWSDAHCIKLLENCYKALPSKGKVILVDYILPNEVEGGIIANLGYRMDMIMFTANEGAKERTDKEIQNISKASGFSRLQVICNIKGCNVVELYK